MKLTLLASLLLPAALFAPRALDQDAPQKATDQEVIEAQLPSYPLKTCVVSGKELGAQGEPVEYVVDGRLVRLCCKRCVAAIDKAPEEFVAKIDHAVIAAQKPAYPMKTCPVSGEKLGESGEPVDYVQGTRLVRFCCKNCVGKFEQDPAKYMAAVDEAWIAAQKATYPLKECPVSGEELGKMGEPVDYLYGTRLVRFCCKNCIKTFKKDPSKFLAKIDAAKSDAAKSGMKD